MKEKILCLLYCLILLFVCSPVYPQMQYCRNLDFSQGNFTNWEGYTWQYSIEHPEVNSTPVPGIVNRRQTIISDNSAYDPNTGNALKLIPDGYQFSARLGDAITEPYQSGAVRCWHQSLRYTMNIDANNSLLIIKFALVLEYADDHTVEEEPHFKLTLYDENGDTIPDCANYNVYASNSSVEGFQLYEPPNSDQQIQWRDWTTVGVDLSGFIGQTITIEFMTSDCTQTYHFGYGYFVASCQPLNIAMRYCTNDSVARLAAPVGFERYSWTNSNGTVVDTLQTLEVASPAENSIFSCKLTSVTGCDVSVQSAINRYSPKAEFNSYMIDCNSNIVQLVNSSTSNRGSLLYLWDFGDGQTSEEQNPRYRFTTSGIHQVSLGIFNTPSVCTDTLTKDVESFSPPLVGIEGDSAYCPGKSVLLKAYGAYEYEWSNGSNNDTIEISAPGGEFWLVGRSSTGCSDTNHITVSEDPGWEFPAEGDTMLCVGENTILNVSGAENYLWNTGDTANFIMVSAPGNYFCTGSNFRGCEKINSFNVKTVPPPGAGFSVSDYTLSERNNVITCSLPAQPDVQYAWNMGDGSTGAGPVFQHAYNISNGELTYTIDLKATDKYGCVNSSSEIIDVIPFIPNVFSPNDDGINDVFMPEIELQVFDRNGILIYKGSEGWDGRYMGLPVDPDTYFYSIYYINRPGQKQNKKGYITLVR